MAVPHAPVLRAWLPRALLTMAVVACQPKTPAQLVDDGRLFEACELADERYPEKSAVTRAAMRRESKLRVELELLEMDEMDAVAGVHLPGEFAVLRYRVDRASARVASDVAVTELRMLGRRYEPIELSDALAVELVAGPDPRPNPDGLVTESFLLLFVFATVPLCVSGGCDHSKLKLPAHQELARRHRERWQHVHDDPDLRRRKDQLMRAFHEETTPREDTQSREGYTLLVSRRDQSAKGQRRLSMVARHVVRGASSSCVLIDRFIVESNELDTLFATRPHLSELPLREIGVWPERSELPRGWE